MQSYASAALCAGVKAVILTWFFEDEMQWEL
jgi:hypothetical protein